MKFFLASVILFLASPPCESSPSGASHCFSGISSMQNTFHGTIGSGSLLDGNYQLHFLDKESETYTPIESITDSDGNIVKIDLFKDASASSHKHVLSLKTTAFDTKFRGFLLRLSATDDTEKDVSSYLSISDSYSQLSRTLEICDEKVSGLTHNSPMDKEEIQFELLHNEAINLTLEITVVEKNKPSGSNLWYYEMYQFQLRDTMDDLKESSQPSESSGSSTSPSISIAKESSQPSESSGSSMSPSISMAPSPESIVGDENSLTTNEETNAPSTVTTTIVEDESMSPSISPSPSVSLSPSISPSKSTSPSVSIHPSAIPSVSFSPSTSNTPTVGETSEATIIGKSNSEDDVKDDPTSNGSSYKMQNYNGIYSLLLFISFCFGIF
ncbi:predicted protein [Chaetoceros tenuissimus]|uniref:Uncharacterized protein n=1 Tax=Chaetoceros tenuissimus TaxID=426638 RepID=A0AAD3D881_9STRA|nr:predicted protein [Chaetoceros tenuissimus]